MKDTDVELRFEDSSPNPEFLIKSIAEQGYSLESALADLIDNSVSANADKVEIIIKSDNYPFRLYLADNGNGMDEEALIINMKFPSRSMESKRNESDLGRFGLGMKTASFSQTRKFTVLSRKKGGDKFFGRTWDVEYLKSCQKWRIIVNETEEIEKLLKEYTQLSHDHLNQFNDFTPNVIIIWDGLFKFEDYLDQLNRVEALQKEITETTSEYLSIVFHRFMEKNVNPLKIRVNNSVLSPFNPFPVNVPGFRAIDYKVKNFKEEIIKLEGFILPSRSIEEARAGLSIWTTKQKGLMDMEGIYIYRANRLIKYGGWKGIVKKMPRMQLARLRVEIGNGADHLIHLNVAKSEIKIPHDLKQAFVKYANELKKEAEKEYFNTGNSFVTGTRKEEKTKLFIKKPTGKGSILELNPEHILIKELRLNLKKEQNIKLEFLLRIINTSVNKIKQVHEDQPYNDDSDHNMNLEDLVTLIHDLLDENLEKAHIREGIITNLGFHYNTLPEVIKKMLNDE